MAQETNGTNNRPAAIITEKFRVKVGGTTVTMGISPKTQTLCVYAYEDAAGYHSLGRWPVAKYSSQWKALIAVGPAVAAFIKSDENSPNPKLAVKSVKTAVTNGDTLEFDATESLVDMLMANNSSMTREQAEELAAASS